MRNDGAESFIMGLYTRVDVLSCERRNKHSLGIFVRVIEECSYMCSNT